jgi:hypothetical protein
LPYSHFKLEPPPPQPRAETAGLDKEEADFVSKYLALADELLNGATAPATLKKSA